MVLNAMAGDRLPVYGDGMQVRNWLFTEDFASAIDVVLERGEAGEVYNVGGPEELPNIDVVKRIIELTGRRRVADRSRRRPARPRPPLLALLRSHRGARLAGAGPLRRGHRADRRLVPRQPRLVGADPLRRVPRVLRAPVRDQARGVMTAAIETTLDGLVAIEPTVHGDERGFLIESFQRRRWRELGVDEAFVQENHSRSTQRGTLRGMHFQTEPGQGKLVRCPRGAIFDVAVDLRRGSPTYGAVGGPRPRRRRATASSGSRSASRHGFQVLSEVADVAYKLTSALRPRHRVRDRLGRPRRRHRVAGRRPAALRARQARAPARRRRRLAAVHLLTPASAIATAGPLGEKRCPMRRFSPTVRHRSGRWKGPAGRSAADADAVVEGEDAAVEELGVGLDQRLPLGAQQARVELAVERRPADGAGGLAGDPEGDADDP